MADVEHVGVLKQGVAAWNAWRLENPSVQPDFRGATLCWEYLACEATGPFVFVADLHAADFEGADLFGTVLDGSDLSGAHLARADLTQTRLRGARLHDADMAYANLTGADLTGADLGAANLRGTLLRGCAFSGSLLAGADLTDAVLCGVAFRHVDLSQVRGLASTYHEGPSSIDVATLCQSRGRIPEEFLRGCGVPEHGIAYARSLAGCTAASDCFIRYAGCDSAFAQQLYRDLQAAGVRCWYAPEGTKVGLVPCEQTGPALRLHDRLVLVLSRESLRRRWLAEELVGLVAEERRRGRAIVLPVRLDVEPAALPADILGRNCVDFAGWLEPRRYQAALAELLSALNVVLPG